MLASRMKRIAPMVRMLKGIVRAKSDVRITDEEDFTDGTDSIDL